MRVGPPSEPAWGARPRSRSPPVPRVPRDQRSPPRVRSPRPRHLRTPPSSSPRMEGGASLPGQKEGRRREEKERRAKGEQEEPKERSNLIPDEEADMSKSNTMTGVSGDWAVFRGPEMAEIDPREMKKIQIDIRRNLPPNKARAGQTVDRSLGDPVQLSVPRRPGEGKRELFDRDEIKQAEKKEEQLVEEQRVMIITEPHDKYAQGQEEPSSTTDLV